MWLLMHRPAAVPLENSTAVTRRLKKSKTYKNVDLVLLHGQKQDTGAKALVVPWSTTKSYISTLVLVQGAERGAESLVG